MARVDPQRRQHRRVNRGMRFTVAVIALLSAAVACTSKEPPGSAPPVIVVFVVDSWSARHAGCYGAQGDPTPNADALAARGIRFEQTWAHSSWTLPSFGSLLASVVPTALWEPDSNARLRASLRPFPRVLADAGYDTFACWNSSLLAPRFGLDAGFASEDFDVFPSRNDFTRSADETVRDALAWLDRKPEEQPVLLSLHVFDSHLSYTPLRVTNESGARGDRFERGVPAFDATERDAETKLWIEGLHVDEIRAVDAALGALVAGLEERGRFENALIVVTSAHGEEMFEHGGFGHGHSVYEEQIAVPLIVRLPRDAHAGTNVAELVRHIDVAPTILDLVGIETPDSYQGTSLRAFWAAPTPGNEARTAGSSNAPRVAVAESLIAGPQRKAVRIGDDKLVTDDARRPLELYDLAEDPEERDDRLDRDPETAERLRAALVRWVGTAAEAPSPQFSLADDPDLRDRLDAVAHPGRAR